MVVRNSFQFYCDGDYHDSPFFPVEVIISNKELKGRKGREQKTDKQKLYKLDIQDLTVW